MRICVNNKDIEFYRCVRFLDRFFGFMGKCDINSALIFPNCNSIHTFFMKENIDVIMCDKEDNVIYIFRDVKKNKIILPKKDVSYTVETPSNYFDISINDKLYFK